MRGSSCWQLSRPRDHCFLNKLFIKVGPVSSSFLGKDLLKHWIQSSKKKDFICSSHCGATGMVASLWVWSPVQQSGLKDPAMRQLQQRHTSLLWLKFSPSPRNLHVPQVRPFKKKKKNLIWPNSLISQMKEPRWAEVLTLNKSIQELRSEPKASEAQSYAICPIPEELEGTMVNRYKIYYRACGPRLHYSLEVYNNANPIFNSNSVQENILWW